MSRMFDRLDANEPALGTFIMTHSPELVESIGGAGLDAVCIDQMSTSLGWSETADMIRTAELSDLTPWVRVAADPWSEATAGAGLVDVFRAITIGAQGITISVSSAEEVESAVARRTAGHQRVWTEADASHRREAAIAPLIETPRAAEQIDEILRIRGLGWLFLGMGDLSHGLGIPNDPTDPATRDFLEVVVRRARSQGVIVMASAPYHHLPGPIAEVVGALWDIGVQVVWITGPTRIAQGIYSDLSAVARDR